jgi:hypothetical protein
VLFDRFYLYMFHYDDDRRGWTSLNSFTIPTTSASAPFETQEQPLTEEFKSRVIAALKHAGWDGDGIVEATFVPGFFTNGGHSWWVPIYHVKQSSNGTSWIACEQRLGLSAKLVRG